MQAAKWLGTDVLTLQGHEDGIWWFWRAQAGIAAENHVEVQRGRQAQRRQGAGR